MLAALVLVSAPAVFAEISVSPDFPLPGADEMVKGDAAAKVLALYRSDVLAPEQSGKAFPKKATAPTTVPVFSAK